MSTRRGGNGSATFWVTLILAYAIAAGLLALAGAPSPYLFAGAVAGCACALFVPNAQQIPERLRSVGLAIIGVTAGSHIDQGLVRTAAERPVAILGGVFATVVVSITAGLLLRLARDVSPSTALLASIAGGASGVAAMARELRADEPVVLTVQYLRVFVVLLSVPFVTQLMGGVTVGSAQGSAGPQRWAGLGFSATALVVGLVGARLLMFTSSRLLIPLFVAAAMTVTEWFDSTHVPGPLLNVGYAVVGLTVGLAFTPRALRTIGRLMPYVFVQLVLGIGGCAGVGLLMAEALGMNYLDGYLATTPGGLSAVTAVAVGSGANVGFVVAVQSLRVVIVLLLVAAIGALVKRRRGKRGE
jgi:membrane AbrB-like protein